MKKLLVILIAMLGFQMAYADNGATNVRIHISGIKQDNSYFLCLSGIGCLSIKAGDNGKVYPVYDDVQLSGIAVLNIDDHFKVSTQPVPASCTADVPANKTITISGELVHTQNQGIAIEHLQCSVS